jgi:hypothetical protein
MNNPMSATFLLNSEDGLDQVFLLTVVEDTKATVEVEDKLRNLLGKITLTIEDGQLLARIDRTAYRKEKLKEITLFHL